jgi:hypothetical protein
MMPIKKQRNKKMICVSSHGLRKYTFLGIVSFFGPIGECYVRLCEISN